MDRAAESKAALAVCMPDKGMDKSMKTSSTSLSARLANLVVQLWRQAGIAQLVEHLICNQRVAGSIPVAGSNFFNHLSGLLINTDSFVRVYCPCLLSVFDSFYALSFGRTCREFLSRIGNIVVIHDSVPKIH